MTQNKMNKETVALLDIDLAWVELMEGGKVNKDGIARYSVSVKFRQGDAVYNKLLAWGYDVETAMSYAVDGIAQARLSANVDNMGKGLRVLDETKAEYSTEERATIGAGTKATIIMTKVHYAETNKTLLFMDIVLIRREHLVNFEANNASDDLLDSILQMDSSMALLDKVV